MSNAFICDICQKYYKDNDHTEVTGYIKDYKGRERKVKLSLIKIGGKDYNCSGFNEIDHICRQCLLKLLASAYPELEE